MSAPTSTEFARQFKEIHGVDANGLPYKAMVQDFSPYISLYFYELNGKRFNHHGIYTIEHIHTNRHTLTIIPSN